MTQFVVLARPRFQNPESRIGFEFAPVRQSAVEASGRLALNLSAGEAAYEPVRRDGASFAVAAEDCLNGAHEQSAEIERWVADFSSSFRAVAFFWGGVEPSDESLPLARSPSDLSVLLLTQASHWPIELNAAMIAEEPQ